LATILIFFVRINLPNFVQFTKQRQYRQHKATQEIRPVEGKVHQQLKALGHNSVIIQTKASNSNDDNNNNIECCVEIVTVTLGLIGRSLPFSRR